MGRHAVAKRVSSPKAVSAQATKGVGDGNALVSNQRGCRGRFTALASIAPASIYEEKYDGGRIVAVKDDGVRLVRRCRPGNSLPLRVTRPGAARTYYFGCATVLRYGFSVLKPCGYFFFASSSETDVGMITS